jgi:hypothetical protein
MRLPPPFGSVFEYLSVIFRTVVQNLENSQSERVLDEMIYFVRGCPSTRGFPFEKRTPQAKEQVRRTIQILNFDGDDKTQDRGEKRQRMSLSSAKGSLSSVPICPSWHERFWRKQYRPHQKLMNDDV